ncbi:histidine--tRNA ligase [Candidatus Dependentiae bacterium]|nr:histidine--tRNA ligase [Candidatus Dependentiae bacterium]
MLFSRVRGTQDWLDLRLYNFLVEQAGKHLQRYNFSQIQTPILEQTNLFVRSLGQETDVVTKEMYVFETSSGESICLRPEATAGTMRAFLENHIEKKPWKVWCYGPMFRHERPQKGRWRQFEQINIEVINDDSIQQDAYFIKMLDAFFKDKLFLENYVIKLNFLGCPDDRNNHKKSLKAYLDTVADTICDTCRVRKEKNILRVFDCKNESCQEVYRDAPKLTDYLCVDCGVEWAQLQALLQVLSVSVVLDPSLVRGLDYYNKTVFEFSSRDLGAQDAFCGGGRYDLSEQLGAKKEHPSIGAAMGVGRLLMLVSSVQDRLPVPHEPAVHVLIPMGDDQQPLALLLADVMQTNGLCVDVLLEGGSMKSMMRKANKMGASHVLIIGEAEQRDGTVSVKNMITGDSVVLKQGEVVSYVRKGS